MAGILQTEADVPRKYAHERAEWQATMVFENGITTEFEISANTKIFLEAAALNGATGPEFCNFDCLTSYRVSVNIWSVVCMSFARLVTPPTKTIPAYFQGIPIRSARLWSTTSIIPFEISLRPSLVDVNETDDFDESDLADFFGLVRLFADFTYFQGRFGMYGQGVTGRQIFVARGDDGRTAYLQPNKITLMITHLDTCRPTKAKHRRTKGNS
jgi:hypothetical protein